MKKLNKLEFISISVMLFGIFFGAGNLIFPPLLGYISGSSTFTSFSAFAISGIVFPMLAVIAVSKTYGLENLARKVGDKFAIIYSVIIFLSIGPGLAIPRNGSVPFEMAIVQYLPSQSNLVLYRLLFTSIFFALSYYFAVHANKLVDSSGKILTPALIILIFSIFIGFLFVNPNQVSKPSESIINREFGYGFIEGYNTLDAIAGLNYGFLIYKTIKSYKIENEKNIIKYVSKSGVLAGFILLVIYGVLSFLGRQISGMNLGFTNGAQIITHVSSLAFGNLGAIITILIFTLACLTTSIGLIISVADYFSTLTPKINVKNWAIIITLFSFVISNFGLDLIMKVTVPVLLIIYPFSLSLIVMGITQDILKFKNFTYKIVCLVTFSIAIVSVLMQNGINIPLLGDLVSKLPLFKQGLEWVLPTFISIVISEAFLKIKNK